MNWHQKAGTLCLFLSALVAGATWGTQINHAVAPVPISDLGLTPEVVQATQSAVATMQPLQVVGGDSDTDNRLKRVNLAAAVKIVNGGEWTWHGPQQTGDCNAFATCYVGETDIANQILAGAEYEFKLLDRPWAYHGGRVRNGKVQLSGEGSVPAWSAEWFRDVGILFMDDAGPYSGSRSKQWGSNSGPPKQMWEKAAPYRIQSFAQMRNAQDVCNAICAGYPVLFGSMNWGTTSIKNVEGRNVARDTTNWPHAECFVAYDGTTKAYSKRGLWRVMNSWGPEAHNPKSTLDDDAPGGYYVTEDVVNMICDEGMCFSISGTQGFPKREIDWDIFKAVGAAASTNVGGWTMFPIDPIAGYLFAAALFVAAVVCLVLGKNARSGGLRIAALAVMITVGMGPTVNAGDALDFGIFKSDDAKSTNTSSTDSSDPLNFGVFVAEAGPASPPHDPLSFSVFQVSAIKPACTCTADGKCTCGDGCECAFAKTKKAKADKIAERVVYPVCPESQWIKLVTGSGTRFYTKPELIDRLSQNGFNPEKLQSANLPELSSMYADFSYGRLVECARHFMVGQRSVGHLNLPQQRNLMATPATVSGVSCVNGSCYRVQRRR